MKDQASPHRWRGGPMGEMDSSCISNNEEKEKGGEREARHAQGPWSVKGPGGPRLLGQEGHREAETCQVLREEKAPDHTLPCTSHFWHTGGNAE